MKQYTRLFLPLTLMMTTATHAQNWEVGVPVDALLSHLFMFGSGCTPGADENFSFPSSPVTGVDYVAIVTQVDQPGTINLLPGATDPLELGDTIWITSAVLRHVYFTSGSGTLDLDFKAIRTPTIAGEAHPCGSTDAWMTDFGICPENLSILMELACTTEDPTGIMENGNNGSWLITPSAANGHRLQLQDVDGNSVMVFDAQGRAVRTSLTFAGNRGSLDMSDLPDGIYVVRATELSGEVIARSFALAR
jgi:hypothetical protein